MSWKWFNFRERNNSLKTYCQFQDIFKDLRKTFLDWNFLNFQVEISNFVLQLEEYLPNRNERLLTIIKLLLLDN